MLNPEEKIKCNCGWKGKRNESKCENKGEDNNISTNFLCPSCGNLILSHKKILSDVMQVAKQGETAKKRGRKKSNS
jgi:hypothetical protein